MEGSLKEVALRFHEFPVPGRVSATLAKSLSTSQDLAPAYSPGVVAPCMEVHTDPQNAYKYIAKDNLVAAIFNGTAVLDLSDIGASVGKPMMESKGILFKKLAGVDVFDIEINEKDPWKPVDIIAALEPTPGGTNPEDIKAPECFYIEHELRERCKVPVFHNDQHGTVIITAAAVSNALRFTGRSIGEATLVCSGANAAAIACLNQLLALGLKRENATICNSKGAIYKTREDKDRMDESKKFYAIEDNGQRVLVGAAKGKDIFLGLSGVNLLTPEMLNAMNVRPIVFAMVNPDPEILPPLAKETCSDVTIGTGRSNFLNQVNNVLCSLFIFRGALDVGVTTINEEIKLAHVYALADLVMEEVSEGVVTAYGKKSEFGADYLIPTPFDRRLISRVATATVKAVMESGVAARPIVDLAAYAVKLEAM